MFYDLKMIPRSEITQIKKWIGQQKILILRGARQVGKTTLVQRIQKDLENQGKKTIYFNADDLDNLDFFQSPHNFIVYLKQYHNLEQDFLYIFIDEFQQIEQAGLFLKNIFDKFKDKLQLIVTGSSSLKITQNTEFLTGRAITFEIYPVAFEDYFNYQNKTNLSKISLKNFTELEDFYAISKTKLENTLKTYFQFGAYPEILIQSDYTKKKELLKSIIKTYLEKDIAFFFAIKHVRAFNDLLKIIADQIGNLFNKNKISSLIGLDNKYITKYIDILEGTYVCKRISPYFKNIRNELTKMPKIFFFDLGLRNYLLTNFETIQHKIDLGQEAENFVFTVLLRNFEEKHVHFFRTRSGMEIDFILEKSYQELYLLEVKYTNQIKNILSFKHFENHYPALTKKKIVCTKATLKKENEIYYIPVCLLPFVKI